jgi:hypothetical protein
MWKFVRPLVLNDPPPNGDRSPRAPHARAEDLQRQALAALAAAATANGRIDYASLRGSSAWANTVEAARGLQLVPLADLIGRPRRLAFWINVYNALVLHAIVALGIRKSVHEVPFLFMRASYRIGGFRLSLDDIEHGVLRANGRRHLPPLRPFGRLDPRGALALETVDPRIHFALNCGAQSCPPVGTYRAQSIDQQLDLAARNFRWYRGDFEAAGGLVPFLLRYLDDGPARAALGTGSPRLRWTAYHWTLAHEPVE